MLLDAWRIVHVCLLLALLFLVYTTWEVPSPQALPLAEFASVTGEVGDAKSALSSPVVARQRRLVEQILAASSSTTGSTLPGSEGTSLSGSLSSGRGSDEFGGSNLNSRRVQGPNTEHDALIRTFKWGIPRKDLKIFVYDLPTKFNHLIAAKHPYCEAGTFGTEIYIHQQMLASPHRTENPEQANVFYVPLYSSCIVYKNFKYFPKFRRLVADAVRYVIQEEPYWNRSRGLDHVWTFNHDYGACLSWVDQTDHVYYTELRNSILLSHVGDLTLGCFSPWRDIVIPPMSSNLEIVRRGLGGAGRNLTENPKTTFAYFRGTVRWYHANDLPELKIKAGYSKSYSNGVRQLMYKLYRDDPLFSMNEGSSDTYVEEVRNSLFCLCPRGFATWSQRLFDSVMLGCIPVIISDQIEMPFESLIDYRKFSVKVDERDLPRLKQILLSIPQSAIAAKQAEMKRIWKMFSYQRPLSEPGDAFDTILELLATRVRRHPPAGPDSWR